ncbi:MAG: hypothetical protein R6V55_13140 [Desulfovermiculus sp.]
MPLLFGTVNIHEQKLYQHHAEGSNEQEDRGIMYAQKTAKDIHKGRKQAQNNEADGHCQPP